MGTVKTDKPKMPVSIDTAKTLIASGGGALDSEQRLHWTTKGLSDASGNAYLAYMMEDAWHDVSQAAGDWLDSRPAN